MSAPREFHLFRYHAGANAVLMAGIISGIVGVGWGLASPAVSFAVGAIPTFLTMAVRLARCGDLPQSVETFRAYVADEEPRR